ncbi:MAG: hypothetical protein ACI4TF_03075 [Oliverpabstia sp.]
MPRELPDSQLEYIKRVKADLKQALYASKYTYTQLQSILEERYGFSINKGTLRDLFDDNNTNLNYACLITTCKFFGFDFNKFLEPETISDADDYFNINPKNISRKPKKNNTHPFIESLKSVNTKFTVLRDDGYMGEFKGYIVAPTKSSAIDEFHLTLYKDEDGIAHAKLIRRAASKQKNECFEYSGIPYHSKAYQSVLLFLTDTKAKGEFYFLSFGFQQYRSEEGLIFRQGLAITGESLRSGSMVAQNFVLLNHDLLPEKQKYIPGLLKTPVNEFCVPVETANKLASEYPEVKILLEKLSGTMNQSKEQVYIFNEDIILSLNRIDLSAYDRIKALLLLKGEALAPEKNYYVADSKYSGFAKNYLLND